MDVVGHVEHPVALVDQLVDDGSVSVAGEVKVARHSIDLKKASHPASPFGIDVLNHLGQLLLIGHPIVLVLLPFGKRGLLQIILHVHQMHLEDVLHVQRQETAGIARKLDVYVNLELLSQMLLVDYEVTVYLGRREVEDRHDAEEEEQGDGRHRDARA